MQQEDSIPKTSPAAQADKPDLPNWMFWEYDLEKLDWHEQWLAVVDRVLERGTRENWKTILGFYGEEKIKDALLNRINSLPDHVIDDVSAYFKLKKEELKCYITKRSRPTHWL